MSSRVLPSVRWAVVGVLSILVLVSGALTSPADAKIGRTFFGMHDAGFAYGDVPLVTAGAIRLWDSGTTWREIERTQGFFEWDRLDRAVASAEANGLRPLIVLGQTPRFYAANPKAPGAYGRGATSMPRLRAWQRYVGKVAHRYGTSADYQVWNEPNISNYWTGTQAQMAKLTATASRKITNVLGAGATVVGPSFPLRMDYQRRWFTGFWHQSVGGRNLTRYVDVIAANLYPVETAGPEAQLPIIRFARHALPTAGRHKPLWNTEINYGLRGGPAAKRISLAKQASYVSRTLLLNANNGIRRMFWYAWDVAPIANTHLRAADGRRTRAGRAWDVTHDWLLGTTPKGCRQTTRGPLAGLWTCTLRASGDEVRRVYYKPTGDAVRVTTVRSTRSWSDLAGHVTERRGRFSLPVGQLPILVTSRR